MENNVRLPISIRHVKTPPLKCQGIKTKLVPFIFKNIVWNEKGKWIEPFLGSGVVLFNLAPKRALAADNNLHIITFYNSIQKGEITPLKVKSFLEKEGARLLHQGQEYYYEVRDRFNSNYDPLDLLFLSRACFNGVMRFNKKGEFNVPFNHKTNRFSKSYITKIVNQVRWVSEVMRGKDWKFIYADWRDTLKLVEESDFAYLDPPYFGRHTDYIGCWSKQEILDLIKAMTSLSCGYALSLWKKNIYRSNTLIDEYLGDRIIRVFSHDYFVGPTVSLRHEIEEALIIKPGFATDGKVSSFQLSKGTMRIIT